MRMEVKTNVIKRNGEEVSFDLDKIVNAIKAANREVDKLHQMNEYQVMAIADTIADKVQEMRRAVHVEDIQDMVETGIMEMRGYEVAQKYVRYRYKRELTRKSNTTDNGILALIEHLNEEVNQENSNKNPVINSTQRDYMAGEVSKDLSRRVLLPEEVVQAHEEGIIHFHDSDYFAQKEHNCDLINLEDMLQNGTVISETMIEKPHSFFTACNVTTQIVAQVASNQYGGQSFSLAHLAPFVDIPFGTFIGLFVIAQTAGVFSQVPGGMGVFETVFLAAFPDSVNKADVFGALLAYRIIYYVLPLIGVGGLFFIYERWLRARMRHWIDDAKQKIDDAKQKFPVRRSRK